jgi:putative ABC transport system permease protein
MAWADPPFMYRPMAQVPLPSLTVVARIGTTVSRSKLSTAVQRAVATLDPNIPTDPLVPVTDLELHATAYPRFRATLLAGFALLALLLATVGLFGVLSHSVAQRRHEIGVRLALGAERRDVVLMIFKEGIWLTGTGIVLGFVVSWALDRYLSALLYGVQPDPLLFTSTALVLLPAAFVAMYLPVRRAAQVDPMVALRYE